MKIPDRKILTAEEIASLSSVYLAEGRKQESWEIKNIEIENNLLTARIRMKSVYISPTDTSGFHLTIFSTLEFLSQLTIIYAHVWAGLDKKIREGWMIECSVTSGQTIRDPNNIEVNMEVISIKKVGENILAVTKSRVFDSTGQFEARLKGFLS